MRDSKLLDVLRNLDAKEIKQLSKFVRSPIHNSNQTTTDLLDYILKVSPNYDSSRLEKHIVFAELFPTMDYNDTYMRRLMSDLFKVCEEFIAWLRFQDNKEAQQLELLSFYREKKLDKHFNTILRKLKKNSEVRPIDEKFYYTAFQIEREIALNIGRRKDRGMEPNLQLISDKLDAYYLLLKLKSCCSIVNHQQLTKKDYELPLLEEILEHLNKKDYNHLPLVKFYQYTLLSLLEGKDKSHFINLRRVLLDHIGKLPKVEVSMMFVHAKNYCIRQINGGDDSYLTEALELYKVELDKGLALEEGYLSPFIYHNMISLGIKIGDFDWTESFIQKYTEKLEPIFKESNYQFNMARLYFSKKEFEKIIPLLHQIEPQEVFMELTSKTLLMKTWYELKEFDSLLSLTDSFRMFLSRKKQLSYHRTIHQNIIKFIKQLVRLQVADSSKLQEFEDKIKETQYLSEKEWFLEKIAELR